jgi:hypothetical protein
MTSNEVLEARGLALAGFGVLGGSTGSGIISFAAYRLENKTRGGRGGDAES